MSCLHMLLMTFVRWDDAHDFAERDKHDYRLDGTFGQIADT